MDKHPLHTAHPVRACCRQGLIALREVILLLILVMGLIWAVSQIATFVVHTPTTPIGGPCRVSQICLHPGNRHLTVYRPVQGVYRCDLETGELERLLPYVPVQHSWMSISAEGTTIALCTPEGHVTMFRDGEEVPIARESISDDVDFLLMSADGDAVICVTSNHRVYGWQRTGADWVEFQYSLSPGAQFVGAFLNRSGRRLLVADDEGRISFYDALTGHPDGTDFNVGSGIAAVAWSENERLIALFTYSNELRLFEADTGHLICTDSLTPFGQHCHGARIAISPDNQRVAVTTNTSGTICIWDLQSAKLAGCLNGHVGIVRSLQFAHESDRLYSGGFDGTVREWSLKTFAQIRIVD
jgi:WD40 repeat protein